MKTTVKIEIEITYNSKKPHYFDQAIDEAAEKIKNETHPYPGKNIIKKHHAFKITVKDNY
jgi:hypothetical protein